MLDSPTSYLNKLSEREIAFLDSKVIAPSFSEGLANLEEKAKLVPIARLLTYDAIITTLSANYDPHKFGGESNPSKLNIDAPPISDWVAPNVRNLLDESPKYENLEQIEAGLKSKIRELIAKQSDTDNGKFQLDEDDVLGLLALDSNSKTAMPTLIAALSVDISKPENKDQKVPNFETIKENMLASAWQQIHTSIRKRMLDKMQMHEEAKKLREAPATFNNNPTHAETFPSLQENPQLSEIFKQRHQLIEDVTLLAISYPTADIDRTIGPAEYNGAFQLLKEFDPDQAEKFVLQSEDISKIDTTVTKEEYYSLLLHLASLVSQDNNEAVSNNPKLAKLANSLHEIIPYEIDYSKVDRTQIINSQEWIQTPEFNLILKNIWEDKKSSLNTDLLQNINQLISDFKQ